MVGHAHGWGRRGLGIGHLYLIKFGIRLLPTVDTVLEQGHFSWTRKTAFIHRPKLDLGPIPLTCHSKRLALRGRGLRNGPQLSLGQGKGGSHTGSRRRYGSAYSDYALVPEQRVAQRAERIF